MRTPKSKAFSIKIAAGSRTYCFDIKTSVEGTAYLVIRELRGNTKEGQVMIFKEHIQAFRKGFGEAVRFVRKSRSKAYNVEQLRRTYPKAYARWTEEEDKKLRKLYTQDKAVKELAGVFQRKPSAIRSRLRKLEKLVLTDS